MNSLSSADLSRSSSERSLTLGPKMKRNSLNRSWLLQRHSSFEIFKSNLAKLKFYQKNLIIESEENSSININMTKSSNLSDGKRTYKLYADLINCGFKT